MKNFLKIPRKIIDRLIDWISSLKYFQLAILLYNFWWFQKQRENTRPVSYQNAALPPDGVW